jgi:hypothetical protein
MRDLTRLLLLTAVAGLFGCAGPRYHSDFDAAVDFSGFSTYAWPEDFDSSKEGDDRGLSPLDAKRVAEALDRALAARGYRKVEADPDFLVNFYFTQQERVDVYTNYDYWGYRGRYVSSRTDVRQWTEGTLVVDLIAAASKELAWRGWTTGSVDRFERMDPEEKAERIDRAVQGILGQFPPGS